MSVHRNDVEAIYLFFCPSSTVLPPLYVTPFFTWVMGSMNLGYEPGSQPTVRRLRCACTKRLTELVYSSIFAVYALQSSRPSYSVGSLHHYPQQACPFKQTNLSIVFWPVFLTLSLLCTAPSGWRRWYIVVYSRCMPYSLQGLLIQLEASIIIANKRVHSNKQTCRLFSGQFFSLSAYCAPHQAADGGGI